MSKILIVDDDIHITDFMSRFLRNKGFEVVVAKNGVEALSLFGDENPELVLLDIMMPELDGFNVCKEMRNQDPLVPILMLTAKLQPQDKIMGLTLGADDYITKPFDRNELVARIEAALRRQLAIKHMAQGRTVVNEDFIRIENLSIDMGKRQASFKGQPIKLSKTEFNLLTMFAEKVDMILERDFLFKEVWGYSFTGNTRTLDNFIMRLRKKLDEVRQAVGEEYPYLETVYGVGYQLKSSKSK